MWAVGYLQNSKNKVGYSVSTGKFSTFNGLIELRSTNKY